MLKKTYWEIHNPLYYWWKSRKIFKMPKCHFRAGLHVYYGAYVSRKVSNSIINIACRNVGFELRTGKLVHNYDPYIEIVLFKTFYFTWIFNWVTKNDENSVSRNEATWEALLEYVLLNKPLEMCIKGNTRYYANKIITITKNIRRNYIKTIKLKL